MKKKIMILLILICISCCIIGLVISNQNYQIENWEGCYITFEGNHEVADNPWGVNAGIVEDDDIGKCVLLTPGTGFTIENINDKEFLLQTKLHPWAASSSDGVTLDISLMGSNDELINEYFVDIDSNDSWLDLSLDIEDINNLSKIKVICDNGKNDDSSWDWLVFRKSNYFESNFAKDGYVRAVTYFGNEWPINFWNSEFECIDSDFEQIIRDGFNSIIIVIPWREFQTTVDKIQYNSYAFDNLNYVMEAAKRHDLDVYTRIGYTWDYYEDSESFITERYLDIMRNEATHSAWLDYCDTVYKALFEYENFKGGFITWEDFWGCIGVCDNEDQNVRINYAKEIGYQKWIKANYALAEYNSQYGLEYSSIDDIPVPRRTDRAMESFYLFYDDYLNTLLAESQTVFPNLSLEVRLDDDLVVDQEGNNTYFSHSKTYSCADSDFTATMYGIPMGYENNGERVEYEDALKHTDYILDKLQNKNDGKPIFVEQFLYMDNTPKFKNNAQIKDNEVTMYLENVADILIDHTSGYGIWVYRDYSNNMIYNSQFALGNKGWITKGNVYITQSNEDGSMKCYLHPGDEISQNIPSIRNHFPEQQYCVSFDVSKCIDADIEVSFGNQIKTIKVDDTGNKQYEFLADDKFDFGIKVISGEIELDNVSVFSFIQEGGLYDYNNSELDKIDGIRILNEKLSVK